MLQHLWTGPISNAAVDVVQGSRSVEVRSVGVTKVSGAVRWFMMIYGFLHVSLVEVLQIICLLSIGCCN